jgi:hypothetical protein
LLFVCNWATFNHDKNRQRQRKSGLSESLAWHIRGDDNQLDRRLVSNYATAKLLLVVLDVIAILILLAGILLTHREINRKINEMESL